jgi:hypothetical protein
MLHSALLGIQAPDASAEEVHHILTADSMPQNQRKALSQYTSQQSNAT